MKVSTTTAVIKGYFEIEDVINILAQAGFDAIDFSFCNYIEKNMQEFFANGEERPDNSFAAVPGGGAGRSPLKHAAV